MGALQDAIFRASGLVQDTREEINPGKVVIGGLPYAAGVTLGPVTQQTDPTSNGLVRVQVGTVTIRKTALKNCPDIHAEIQTGGYTFRVSSNGLPETLPSASWVLGVVRFPSE